ncbi:restriction endonuclease subunit S [Psychrosphaera aestuarii]|uniref:restriction endonuclease subunit S n=1 Tax=Psychrosphaera aestuarii TaxID=1266052 RepID=UPI001B332CE2|nr:restriction endonuclease subunit S [Psychrosphaera aestuarii]
MAGRYQPYPDYKNTGISCLDKLPTHWETTKVRFEFEFGKGLPITKANLIDSGIPCVNYGEIHSKFGFEVDPDMHPLKCVSEDYLKSNKSSILNLGDIVFADTSEDIEGSGNFTQLISDQRVFAGYHTVITRPKKKHISRFLAYLFDSSEYRKQIQNTVKGVKVFTISQAILKGTSIWIPSPDEQQKIANFLDHETAKIDTLIAKQEKLIKLLKEKRQAVISHAVTRGLNPEAPMKDSGVEWLGEVPENWIVAPIKRIAELTPKKSEIANKKEFKCSFVPMDKLKQDSLVLDESKLISEVYDGYTYFKNEDVLIAKVTPCFENKNMVVARDLVNGIGFGSSEIYVLRTTKKILNDFLYYRLQEEAFMDIATAAMTGAGGLKRVPANVITNFSIALPSKTEQTEIVVFLKKRLKQLDSLCEKAKAAIELMKERKTTLISAAVTGKIDVRNYKAEKAGI